jgi:hypothetical protein
MPVVDGNDVKPSFECLAQRFGALKYAAPRDILQWKMGVFE